MKCVASIKKTDGIIQAWQLADPGSGRKNVCAPTVMENKLLLHLHTNNLLLCNATAPLCVQEEEEGSGIARFLMSGAF